MTKKVEQDRTGGLGSHPSSVSTNSHRSPGAPGVESPAIDAEADDKLRRGRKRAKGATGTMPRASDEVLQARHGVIGAGLRRIFDEIVEEPVPSEFLDLLNQIDRKGEQ